MTAILNFLKSIGSLIVSLVSFIMQMIESLGTLITQIPAFISFLSASVTILPAVIIPFVLASISIYVVYLIVGRE